MKKLITSSLLFICFYVHSSAQSFGIRSGINISTMDIFIDDTELSDYEFTNFYGFYGGFFGEFKIWKSLHFETGIYCSQKGYNYRSTEKYESFDFDLYARLNLMYLEVPLMPRFNLDVKNGRILIFAGPSIGIGIHGTINISTNLLNIREQKSNINWGNKENDQYKRLDIGGQFGIGYELNRFQIGIQYNHGLTNIWNSKLTDEIKSEIKNKVFTLFVGYRFYN